MSYTPPHSPSAPAVSTASKLQMVHDALLEEMAHIQAKLPDDVEDISESFERYTRIVALLVRSLEALLRLNKQQQQTNESMDGGISTEELLTNIEQRLAQVARPRDEESVPAITSP